MYLLIIYSAFASSNSLASLDSVLRKIRCLEFSLRLRQSVPFRKNLSVFYFISPAFRLFGVPLCCSLRKIRFLNLLCAQACHSFAFGCPHFGFRLPELRPSANSLLEFPSRLNLVSPLSETFRFLALRPIFASSNSLASLDSVLRKIRYIFWICLYSSSTGVSRPKIDTIALNFDLSGYTSVISPINSENGPDKIMTLSPALTSSSTFVT